MFFETFVAMELLRQSEWAEHEVQLYHYRDRAQREVDLVLERNSGDTIGVEVKAAATAAERDFRGLQFLRDKLGPRFKAGAVLYTGDRTHCRSVTVSPRYPSRDCGATRPEPFREGAARGSALRISDRCATDPRR